MTNQKDYELFLSDVVFAFDGLEKFGFTEGGSYHLTNMAEGNCLRNIIAPKPRSRSVDELASNYPARPPKTENNNTNSTI